MQVNFSPDKWGVNLPIYYGVTDIKSTPKFNPLDQDVKYQDALDNASSDAERQEIEINLLPSLITRVLILPMLELTLIQF